MPFCRSDALLYTMPLKPLVLRLCPPTGASEAVEAAREDILRKEHEGILTIERLAHSAIHFDETAVRPCVRLT
jgi:hypothetical protein